MHQVHRPASRIIALQCSIVFTNAFALVDFHLRRIFADSTVSAEAIDEDYSLCKICFENSINCVLLGNRSPPPSS